jgi:DNA-binding transcriptional LysR family regulator
MGSLFDLKRLNTFFLVSKRGSLERAATELKLTIPTISAQIKTLERELNVNLFHHLPNKLVLTEQGKVFLDRVEAVLTSFEKAKASVSNESNEFGGKLSVSIGNDVARLIAPSIAAFIKNHPRLEITILARRPPESLSLVVNREIDLAVGRFRSLPAGILKEQLLENGLGVVVPFNHKLGKKDALSLADISQYPIITLTRNSETRKTIDLIFRKHDIKPVKLLEVGSCQSAVEFAKFKVGIALVHDICVLSELKSNMRFVDMSNLFGKTAISIIRRKNLVVTSAHQAFIEIFRSNSEALSRLL